MQKCMQEWRLGFYLFHTTVNEWPTYTSPSGRSGLLHFLGGMTAFESDERLCRQRQVPGHHSGRTQMADSDSSMLQVVVRALWVCRLVYYRFIDFEGTRSTVFL